MTEAPSTNETTKVLKSIDERINNMSTNIEIINESEKETAELKKKENNLCIFNVPETVLEDPEEAYRQDVEKLATIIGNKEEIKRDIVGVVRRGKKFPRPMIVRFSSLETRKSVLQLRDLVYKNQENEETPIYISPDRTFKQQQEHKKLVLELKKKRAEDPSIKLSIRNGKIITLQPFRRNPQLYWGNKE